MQMSSKMNNEFPRILQGKNVSLCCICPWLTMPFPSQEVSIHESITHLTKVSISSKFVLQSIKLAFPICQSAGLFFGLGSKIGPNGGLLSTLCPPLFFQYTFTHISSEKFSLMYQKKHHIFSSTPPFHPIKIGNDIIKYTLSMSFDARKRPHLLIKSCVCAKCKHKMKKSNENLGLMMPKRIHFSAIFVSQQILNVSVFFSRFKIILSHILFNFHQSLSLFSAI